MDTKLDKFKNGIINSLGFIMVAGIVAVFFAKSFVTIGETGKTVQEIIADGIFALLLGWSIKVLLGYQGVLSGMQSKAMQKTLETHGNTVVKIEPYSPHLPTFCDKENSTLRIRKRRLILSKQYLHYEDVFCDNPKRLQQVIEEKVSQIECGNTIDTNDLRSKMRKAIYNHKKRKLRKKIMRCVRKANNVHITELSQSVLTTDGANGDNPFAFPSPIGKHVAKKSVTSIPIAIAFAVVFGYYGYSLVDNPSWATVIGGMIQIGSLLAIGTLQFLIEYIYCTDTYRKGIVRKIDLLDKFYEEAKANNGNFTVPEEIIKTNKQETVQAKPLVLREVRNEQ